MPLKACPECGKEVSSKAARCPHCGAPSSDAFGRRDRLLLVIMSCLLGFLCTIALIYLACNSTTIPPGVASGTTPVVKPPAPAPPSWNAVAKWTDAQGKDLLLAGRDRDLLTMALDNPTSPRTVGRVQFAAPIFHVATSGSLAAVALGKSGLALADLGDPAHPRPLGRIDSPGEGYGVAFSKRGLLLADGTGGLRVFNIDDPTSPRLVGSYFQPDYAKPRDDLGGALGGMFSGMPGGEAGVTSVAAAGDLAYIADRDLRVLDLADPAHPRLAGGYEGLRWARRVVLSDRLVFALFIFSGPMAFALDAPAQPAPRGIFMSNTTHPCMAIAGQIVYVGNSQMYDTSFPAPPEPGDASQFGALDWSDPLFPRELGSVQIPGDALGLTIIGNHAYVAAGAAGLIVVDVSDPRAMRLARPK